MPSQFDQDSFLFTGNESAKAANYYHSLFTRKSGRDSLLELAIAIGNGARVSYSNGFYERNTLVAQESDILLAITFGNKEQVKPGGTSDTVGKYLNIGKTNAYHLNLNDLKIYNIPNERN